MSTEGPYTERMSRIFADAQPAPPRVGCVLLRSRLGARGRDGSDLRTFASAERRALAEELGVIAGSVAPLTPAAAKPEADDDSGTLAVFFVDPSSKTEQYGGPDGWARCVKGYLNARGYGASIGVATTREAALAAARSRWGIVVIHDGQSTPVESVRDHDPRVQTGVGLKSPVLVAGSHAPRAAHPAHPPQPGQLGLPGLVLGRPKRHRARSTPTRAAG